MSCDGNKYKQTKNKQYQHYIYNILYHNYPKKRKKGATPPLMSGFINDILNKNLKCTASAKIKQEKKIKKITSTTCPKPD